MKLKVRVYVQKESISYGHRVNYSVHRQRNHFKIALQARPPGSRAGPGPVQARVPCRPGSRAGPCPGLESLHAASAALIACAHGTFVAVFTAMQSDVAMQRPSSWASDGELVNSCRFRSYFALRCAASHALRQHPCGMRKRCWLECADHVRAAIRHSNVTVRRGQPERHQPETSLSLRSA